MPEAPQVPQIPQQPEPETTLEFKVQNHFETKGFPVSMVRFALEAVAKAKEKRTDEPITIPVGMWPHQKDGRTEAQVTAQALLDEYQLWPFVS
jgi:hypothetical protein